jgi:hypothetical protein
VGIRGRGEVERDQRAVRESGAESGLDLTMVMKVGRSGVGERRESAVEVVGGESELSLVRMTRERRLESKEAETELMRSAVSGMKGAGDWE